MNYFLSSRGFLIRFSAVVVMMVVLAMPQYAVAAVWNVGMRDDAEASIRMTANNDTWDGLGWQPVVVRIENRSARAGTWKFEFSAWVGYNRNTAVLTPVEISVPARSTSETVVFVCGPGRSVSAHMLTSSWGSTVSGPDVASNGYTFHTGSRVLDFTLVATTPRIEEAVRRAVTGVTGPPASASVRFEVASISPQQWPADWRVWSSFSAIVISREEHDALDGARRNALREWVAQGGALWVVPAGARVAWGGTESSETQVGLGQIYSGLDSLLGNAESATHRRIAPWKSVAELVTNDDRANWDLEKPLVTLIVFLVVFGIVVGPINVFVFAPASRRQRLFLTVPVISLGASLLLGAVIVVKDGFHGAGVRRSLVVLLPGENKAAVFQEQVARTGVLLGKQFALPADTLITIGSGGSAGLNQDRELERAGDTASGAWFTSRAVQVHELRRITPTRARVELVEGGADGRAPVVQSSVTTVLTDFRYVDAVGNRWTADELPPGKRVTLTSTTTADRGDVPEFFRARGGATDLAPVATHASITWNDDNETVIYTGRVETARQP